MAAVRRTSRQNVLPAKRSSDSSASSEESDFEDIEDSESDYEAPQKAKTQKPKAKRQKTGPSTALERNQPGEPSENDLFKALSDPSVAVSELALEWVSQYLDSDETNYKALADLLNLVLKAVGCSIQLQPHDLTNPDLAASTVADLTALFSRQRYHEFPLVSTNKDVKHFRKNLLEFFQELIFYAHEKGCLYQEESESDDTQNGSPLVYNVFAWLKALSTSPARPLRLVATVVLLSIQTQLCHQAMSNLGVLEKLQRQLSTARGSTKSKRHPRGNTARIDTLSLNIKLYQSQREQIDEYLDEVIQGLFIHRYRDVDQNIRTECIKALGEWMLSYPAFFFLSAYLRYFGWLLSDPTNTVREEVVRVLHRLYKFVSQSLENVSVGLRNFTERFKLQLVNMIWKEKVHSIKSHLYGVYLELLKLNFLTDNETVDLCLYLIYLADVSAHLDKPSAKLSMEVAKFSAAVCIKRSARVTEKFSVLLNGYKPLLHGFDDENLHVEKLFKYRCLIDIFREAYAKYHTRRVKLTSHVEESSLRGLFEYVFSCLYQTPEYTEEWEVLLNYVLADTSAMKFRPNIGSPSEPTKTDAEDFRSFLDLRSNEDVACLMGFLDGALCAIEAKGKTKRADLENTRDLISFFAMKVAPQLADLGNLLSKTNEMFSAFLRLVNILLASSESPSLTKIFEDSESMAQYNNLHGKILQFFMEADLMGKDITDIYQRYFTLLLGDKSVVETEARDRAHMQICNSSIYLKVEDVLLYLTTEVCDALSSTEPTGFAVDEDEQDNDDYNVGDQKDLCNTLLAISSPISKLKQVGDFININKFTSEPTLSHAVSMMEMLCGEFLSKLSLVSLVRLWPNNLVRVIDDYKVAWDELLSFLLVSVCWKLEDLLYANNDDTAHSINVDLFLDDVVAIVRELSRSFVDLLNFFVNAHDRLDQSDARKRLVPELECIISSYGLKLADILTSLRAFYNQNATNNSFRGFDAFFKDNDRAGTFVQGTLPLDLEKALLELFLLKEAKLAGALGATLEREDDENVNFGEFQEAVEDADGEDGDDDSREEDFVTRFDSSDEEEDGNEENATVLAREKAEEEARAQALEARRKARQDKRVWEYERDISVCVIKFMSLAKAGALSMKTVNRMKLNSTKLGDTFQTVLVELVAKLPTREENTDSTVTASANADATEASAIDLRT